MAIKKRTLIFLFLVLSIVFLFSQENLITEEIVPDENTINDSLKAQILYLEEAEYPALYAIQKLEGSVGFKVKIFPDSTFEIAEVIEKNDDFESYARKALRNSKFQPAYVKGIPVESFLDVYIHFPSENYKKKKTITFDPILLKKNILQYVEDQNIARKNSFFIAPNYTIINHLKGEINRTPIIIKNGFLTINEPMNNSLLYQNYIPLYHIEKDNDLFYLNTPLYRERPLLTYTDMGIGSQEIKYANIKFDKDRLLEIDSLNFHAGFFAQDGYSLSIQEKSSNSCLNVNWQNKDYAINLDFLGLNQQFSSERINLVSFPSSQNDVISEHQNQVSLLASSRFIKIGLSNSLHSFSSMSDNHYENNENKYLTGTRLKFYNNDLDYSIQFHQSNIKIDSLKKELNNTYHLLDHSFNICNLTLKNNIIYKNLSDLYTNNKLSFAINERISLISEYQRQKKEPLIFGIKNDIYSSSSFKAGFITNYSILKSEFTAGVENDIQTFDLNNNQLHKYEKLIVVNIQTETSYSYQDYVFNIYFMNEFNNSEVLNYKAKYVGKSQIKITKNLLYDNAICAGLDFYYQSSVIAPPQILSSAVVLDTFLGVQITKLFEFKLDFKNMLNTKKYFNDELNPYYIGASIKWNFIN